MRRLVAGPALAVVLVLAGCADAVPGSATSAGSGGEGALLVAAGDIACAPGGEPTPQDCRHEDTAALVEELGPDVVLALGDTQYEEADAEEYAASYDRTWGRFLDITYAVAGNHEYLSGDADDYFAYFGDRAGKPDQGWYSFDVEGWHVVVLNSECDEVGGCEADSPQGEWLAADLAENPARCTLAAWHNPRFSSGAEHGSDEDVAPLWELLDEAGAELVLSGHEHVYERFAPQDADGTADDAGMVQFVVGTGGEELRELGETADRSRVRWNSSFGVLALTLRPDGYGWRFHGIEDAPEVDSGEAACS
ncbi:metallophosphoesterase family protein [Pseudonocardia nigra]|uniref:metallophosphoesterase family protein n=1 Tax=Pseudonocardia nigra TaxID=1921578 RepID=UPI001C603398|nr:metallophosphoesterase [Pseudonocardia nigra]